MVVSDIFYVTIAYLVGSIPTGFIVARLNGISDIRLHGSGNIGATNVSRILGIRYFFLIFALDFLKATICLLSFVWLGFSANLLIGASVALLLGNAFPIFLGFNGGKGVATAFGIIYALHAYIFFMMLFCWAAVFGIHRTVGKASIAALIALPILAGIVVGETTIFLGLTLFISCFCLYLHRNNIRSYLVS